MLDLLLRDPELRRQSAGRAQKRIQTEYAWPAIARAIETSYYEVLGWKRQEAAKPVAGCGPATKSAPVTHMPVV
jgi:hypothetical protein